MNNKNYIIFRVKNIKSNKDITKSFKHCARLMTVLNADKNKTHLNKILLNTLNVDFNNKSSMYLNLKKYYSSKNVKYKQNNILLKEGLITASPGFFENLTDVELNDWIDTNFRFLQEKFENRLCTVFVHLDEKTPHIHFYLKTDKSSLKRYKNQCGEFFKETTTLVGDINKEDLVNLQTEIANANQKFNLSRGELKSSRIHKPVVQFYKDLELEKKKLEEKQEALKNVHKRAKVFLLENKHKIDSYNELVERIRYLEKKNKLDF